MRQVSYGERLVKPGYGAIQSGSWEGLAVYGFDPGPSAAHGPVPTEAALRPIPHAGRRGDGQPDDERRGAGSQVCSILSDND